MRFWAQWSAQPVCWSKWGIEKMANFSAMKKALIGVALAVGISLPVRNAMAEQVGFKVMDTISGSSLKLIQTAIPRLAGAGLNVDGYRITVVMREGRPGVLFEDENKRRGQYGSAPGQKPDFEVRFSEDGSHVVSAHFSR
jgi:hypothetical protein